MDESWEASRSHTMGVKGQTKPQTLGVRPGRACSTLKSESINGSLNVKVSSLCEVTMINVPVKAASCEEGKGGGRP